MTAQIDEKTFKKVLYELMVEQPEYFKNLFRQIVEEKTDHKTERRKRLEKIIQEDFAEYEDVFKALA